MISITQKGDFSKTSKYLKKLKEQRFYEHLEDYAKLGVEALKEATPVDTGKTAASWDYEITVDGKHAEIVWTNSNVVDGWANVAIMLQYGHGTGTGGYVKGRDYINPAMSSVFEKMVEELWAEVVALE